MSVETARYAVGFNLKRPVSATPEAGVLTTLSQDLSDYPFIEVRQPGSDRYDANIPLVNSGESVIYLPAGPPNVQNPLEVVKGNIERKVRQRVSTLNEELTVTFDSAELKRINFDWYLIARPIEVDLTLLRDERYKVLRLISGGLLRHISNETILYRPIDMTVAFAPQHVGEEYTSWARHVLETKLPFTLSIGAAIMKFGKVHPLDDRGI